MSAVVLNRKSSVRKNHSDAICVTSDSLCWGFVSAQRDNVQQAKPAIRTGKQSFLSALLKALSAFSA